MSADGGMRRGNSESSPGGQDEPGLLGGPTGMTRSREAAGRSLGLVAGLCTPSNGKECVGKSEGPRVQSWWPLVHVTIICLSLMEMGSPCRPRGSSLPGSAPLVSLKGSKTLQSQAWAYTLLGDTAGLGDYGLFSASLFRAQLSGMPLGLSPSVAAVSVLQGSWAVASVIVAKTLALGAPTVFLPDYFYMLSGPP